MAKWAASLIAMSLPTGAADGRCIAATMNAQKTYCFAHSRNGDIAKLRVNKQNVEFFNARFCALHRSFAAPPGGNVIVIDITAHFSFSKHKKNKIKFHRILNDNIEVRAGHK